MTLVIGLTGSIAMGKSTIAAFIRRERIPLFDADEEVHRLMAPRGRAVDAVIGQFPTARERQGGIDRQVLGGIVFADPSALRRLESILHPMVHDARSRFLSICRRQRRPVAVLDIPLLFEGGGERRLDAVLLVSAPFFLQRQRVARPGMTEAKFAAIRAKQMPDHEKRRRTRHIIPSGLGKRPALMALRRSLRAIGQRRTVTRKRS